MCYCSIILIFVSLNVLYLYRIFRNCFITFIISLINVICYKLFIFFHSKYHSCCYLGQLFKVFLKKLPFIGFFLVIACAIHKDRIFWVFHITQPLLRELIGIKRKHSAYDGTYCIPISQSRNCYPQSFF